MITEDPPSWADAALARAGRVRTGACVAVQDRPWGRVWSLPTDQGTVWLKEPGEAVRFEVALLTGLADLGLTPSVLAADDTRVLLADAGRTLRDLHEPEALATPFTAALVQVGDLQRTTAPRVPALLAAGVADLRPGTLVGRFDDLLVTLGPIDGDTARARAVLGDVCTELAASAVPASIDHNDLHDGNVMVDAGGRTTVIDWGDAVVAHPFATLLVAQRVLADAVDCDVDDPWDVPVVAAARRAYLAGFAEAAPDEDLERTARLAVLAAHVARSWVWRRAMTTFDAASDDVDLADFADSAHGWLELAVAALTDARRTTT